MRSPRETARRDLEDADVAAIDAATNEGMPCLPEERPMARRELALLLNRLLEAERAGAKVLSAYLAELPPDSDAWRRIQLVQRDEARNCAVLIRLLRQANVEPSMATGKFYDKALAIQGWRERLKFLNRGQAWVAREIDAALPDLRASEARSTLRQMRESHLANIRACEDLLA
jgi:nitronate monooxygenase